MSEMVDFCPHREYNTSKRSIICVSVELQFLIGARHVCLLKSHMLKAGPDKGEV